MPAVDYLVLADAAAVAEGKHYIHGAGWDRLYSLSYPVTHPQMAAAARIAVSRDEAGHPIDLSLDVLDKDERSILTDHPGALRGPLMVHGPDESWVGAELHLPVVFSLTNVVFPDEGAYSVVVRLDGVEAMRSVMHVCVPPGASRQDTQE